MKKLIMAVVAALSLTLIPAAAAHASVPVVQIESDYSYAPGQYLNDDHGTVGYNNPIISFGTVTNGDEDFEMIEVPYTFPGVPTDGLVYQFEYAPLGVPSGYCLSVPTFTPGEALVLRACATGSNQWQDMYIGSAFGPYTDSVLVPGGAAEAYATQGVAVNVTELGVNGAPVEWNGAGPEPGRSAVFNIITP